ncbi:Cytochrome P450, E-class, group I [Heracleum sosnowskyi]|uniref:Cytochrome P450, E-class, group I n=1 Tax=Heracleum sosnowskyi TaxID=360622 RepID=A0AAD8MIG2_9APIA|nr:Cytochrome P450, E-class, group I [Heracleum sosnowskyi]
MDILKFASTVFVLSSLSVFLFVSISLLNKLWLTPIRKQRFLRRQGIKGTSYKFLHGNTKEILSLRKESMGMPMDYLSHNLFPRFHPHFYSWLKIYGKNFLTWYGPRAELFVTEVEFVKEIMNKIQDYPKIEMSTGFVKVLLGDGLVTAKGKKWAKQRKLANQVFHADSLKSMTPAMIASVEMMLDRWKQHEGKEIDVFQEFKFLSSEIISRTAFGSSFMEGKDIFDMLTEIAIIITRNSYRVRLPGLSRFFKSEDDIRSEKLEQGIHDSILRIMEKRKKESAMRGEVGSFGTDFLGSLMKAMIDSDQDKRITIQDVIDECKTFYVAGQETTSTMLSWVVFLLGSHTDWQEKARQEVLNLFGKEQPNSDGIARLKIVNMIINETLRLYPPVTEFTRQVKEETKLGNYILPANIHVVLSTLALHHDTNIWGEDAHQFKPERFSQGVAKATNNNPAVYIPFGLGPRSCVGLNFATNEAKISLTMILQRYSFTLSPTYIHSPIQILTTRPQHGVQQPAQSSTPNVSGDNSKHALLAGPLSEKVSDSSW